MFAFLWLLWQRHWAGDTIPLLPGALTPTNYHQNMSLRQMRNDLQHQLYPRINDGLTVNLIFTLVLRRTYMPGIPVTWSPLTTGATDQNGSYQYQWRQKAKQWKPFTPCGFPLNRPSLLVKSEKRYRCLHTNVGKTANPILSLFLSLSLLFGTNTVWEPSSTRWKPSLFRRITFKKRTCDDNYPIDTW